jgi:hypothetical protein
MGMHPLQIKWGFCAHTGHIKLKSSITTLKKFTHILSIQLHQCIKS